jgi:xanthine dehydrogenase small subunit
VEAGLRVLNPLGTDAPAPRGPGAADRATLEGATAQRTDRSVPEGRGGFADDAAPRGALVALVSAGSAQQGPEYVTAPSLAAARGASGKVQGRRSTAPLSHPLELPEGSWALTLRTTWLEPAYLEPDASWCEPGGPPASPLANGGAFGGKVSSPVPATARRLADSTGSPVRVLWNREDVVRWGPKRPPIAAALHADGTGIMRVARTPGAQHLDRFAAQVGKRAPGIVVEPVDVGGPPVSGQLRAAGWGEAAVLLAALEAQQAGASRSAPVAITAPGGGRAEVTLSSSGEVLVEVWAGDPLDEVTLRSYCLGAVHQGLGWVWSEGIGVDGSGVVQDLTVRSFGILSASAMPRVQVVVHRSDAPPVAVSDAVFVATAAAAWRWEGTPPSWPTRRAALGRP